MGAMPGGMGGMSGGSGMFENMGRFGASQKQAPVEKVRIIKIKKGGQQARPCFQLLSISYIISGFLFIYLSVADHIW